MDPGTDVECRVQTFEEGGVVRGCWLLSSRSCRSCNWPVVYKLVIDELALSILSLP